jgi:hypothetical protein
MRTATTLLLVFLALPALAQPCDPAATDEVCPDTTDWHRYFPLEVGNQWQYLDDFYDEPVAHWSWAVTGRTEVSGQTYFELERCDEAADGSATCAEPLLLRYDDEHELILRRTDDGDVWWDVLPCNLGGAFNTGTSFDEPQECTGPAAGFVPVSLQGGYDATVAVPPDEVTGDTRKEFTLYPGTGPEMYAGLGVTKYYYDLQENPSRLVYAYVGGEQVGTPAFASCDPAEVEEDVVCPDTTDWRRYFPLAVGNKWQYELSKFCGVEGFPACRSGSEIVGSEIMEGTEYFLIRRCTEGLDGEVSCGEARPIRYDEELRTVVVRAEDGMTYPYLGLCLALPFGDSIECSIDGENGFEWYVSGQYGAIFDLGVGPTLVGTTKGFDSLGGGVSYFAGIGKTFSQGDASEISESLVYARIDGVEYGTPEFTFPTSSEPEAAQPVVTGITAAFPNPARDAMQTQYTLADPQTVTLELIDLLGRRVRETELGPQPSGAHDLRLDLGGLRPGLYVLRLRGDAGAKATRRVVVVR